MERQPDGSVLFREYIQDAPGEPTHEGKTFTVAALEWPLGVTAVSEPTRLAAEANRRLVLVEVDRIHFGAPAPPLEDT
jgi:hypothetical protein